MNIILLSGGSGKRLWPLSNDVRSKQFIKLFKNNDEYESMVRSRRWMPNKSQCVLVKAKHCFCLLDWGGAWLLEMLN